MLISAPESGEWSVAVVPTLTLSSFDDDQVAALEAQSFTVTVEE